MAEQATVSPRARALATTHPHALYGFAAVEAVVFVILGAVLMARSVGAGAAVMVIGLACAAITSLPARWSELHPDQARSAVADQTARRQRLARRHLAYFLVVVPVIAAADATLRWNAGHHSHRTLGWVIPAAAGLAIGGIFGAVLVVRARRSPGRATANLSL